MDNLQRILELLERFRGTFQGDYFIPEAWNVPGFNNVARQPNRPAQINVNPYEFIAFCIRRYVIEGQRLQQAAPALERELQSETSKIERNVIYSMLPRMFTAWDHYYDGELNSGTFLKTICLLPFLKKLQVNIIYLLPVFKYSDQCKKSRLGSPYAIKDIYRLDPNLHDPLLGTDSTLVELEFHALVEACHCLEIKVMVDFVFRTVARDNDLMWEHPEWFYWIDVKHRNGFKPPVIEDEPPLTLLNNRSFPSLYRTPGIRNYLAQFCASPRERDPVKWQMLIEEARQSGRELLELVEEQYGLTTAPGFSDVLNDNQPLWTDVTYLRFYFDHHPEARPYLPVDQPPYILQDVACLNLYQGEAINQELWEYTAQVIPFYQVRFQIDGARIDMGHALPPALNREIIARIKEQNPDFILWSEEFAVENAKQAKQDGFHFINGDLWTLYKSIGNPGFTAKLQQILSASELPLIAALETPDTSRLALVNDRKKVTLLVMLNYLLPNVVPFINNGMELAERQPMNLGFNDVAGGEYVLDQSDPMYGRLAFFDPYQLHWLNPHREWMVGLIRDALLMRKQFRNQIKLDYLSSKTGQVGAGLFLLGYENEKNHRNLWLISNLNAENALSIDLKRNLPERLCKWGQCFQVVWYRQRLHHSLSWLLSESWLLEAGETVIGYVE